MTFKRRGRANTTIAWILLLPANTVMPNVPDQLRQKCTYGNIAETELRCVRAALYLETNTQAYEE